jgi:hypothetical protein
LLVQWCFACLCNTCGTAATCFGQVRESKRIQVLTGMSGPFLFLCMRNKALKFFTPFTLKVHPQRLKFCGDVWNNFSYSPIFLNNHVVQPQAQLYLKQWLESFVNFLSNVIFFVQTSHQTITLFEMACEFYESPIVQVDQSIHSIHREAFSFRWPTLKSFFSPSLCMKGGIS